MKLTVLVDNNTYIDKYFYGEPAVSYFIEDEGKSILYDVGYSEAFILNARKLNINLLKLNYLVFSHGHLDHTWGLDPLLRMYMEADTEGLEVIKPKIIAHPKTFFQRPRSWLGGAGSLVSEERVSNYFEIQKSKEPVWLTQKLVCFGNIPKSNDFELKKGFKKIRIGNEDADDYMEDEIALAYKGEKGLLIVSGCSHRGICNIIDYAKKVCKEDRIYDVVGGFHLMNPENELLEKTVNYFSNIKPVNVHACHCTDFKSKVALSKVANLQEVGVGLTLEYK
jgi:7,8-dihydropterin-6-yl-methyl-4-(beta-D-ribofuranosyl)aminobenzene 5'-phosphate synthase